MSARAEGRGAPDAPAPDARPSVFGVPVRDLALDDAIAWVRGTLDDPPARTRAVYFVNAHTMNLAWEDPGYADVLRAGDQVFGDGTGVRWGVRLIHGRRLRDNVNGTDLVPRLLEALGGRGHRVFLLGATPEAVERAARHVCERFPGWTVAGWHHGYLDGLAPAAVDGLLRRIEAARPDLLLVGMGNPLQERWIHAHRDRLRVPVAMGVGGLFAYWSGDLDRAPAWVRRLGFEWLHLLLRQPRKAGRYLVGNPLFLARVWRERARRRRTAAGGPRAPLGDVGHRAEDG